MDSELVKGQQRELGSIRNGSCPTAAAASRTNPIIVGVHSGDPSVNVNIGTNSALRLSHHTRKASHAYGDSKSDVPLNDPCTLR